MSFTEFIILFFIAGITGSIAKALTGFTRGGCFLSVVVGFIGAVIGKWMAEKLDFPELFVLHVGGIAFPVVWAIIGAVVFTTIINLISPRPK